MKKAPLAFAALCCALASLVCPHGSHAGALMLDGIGDIVTFPGTNIPSGSAPFTIEAWINPISIPTGGANGGQITFWGNQGSANQTNGFRLRGSSGVRHYFWGNDHDENFGIDILPDTTGPHSDGWHHLAITWNGSQTTWYWNGTQLGSPRTATGVNVAATNHRIGSRIDAEYFHGLIDEIRIWNVARTSTDIANNRDIAMSGTEPGLVALFNFENGLADAAGGDNNGTAVGDAVVSTGASAPIATSGPRITSFTADPASGFEGDTFTYSWAIDTAQVTGALSVEIRDASDAVVHTSTDASGSAPLVLDESGGALASVAYTLRAIETGGSNMTREATATVSLDPGIPAADRQSGLQAVESDPLAITLTGSDPNNYPNPLAYEIVDPPGHGALTGAAPDLTYTAEGGYLGPDQFTFRVSDGKYQSAIKEIELAVVPAPAPPTAVRLSNTNISDRATPGNFLAALSSDDINPGDTHTYALVAGEGDADNALVAIAGSQLKANASFAGLLGNTYSIRVRSTDSAGFSVEAAFLLTVVEVSHQIVINEVNYNPPDNTVPAEFVELFNPSDDDVDLTGWRLSGAVDFAFPGGTTIAAGGYLVVAYDPAVIQSVYGVAALGPWSGRLSSDGENVRLRDATDEVVDLVDYSSEFPWPVAANGGGGSIELINPALDNSLGSSWRSSYVPAVAEPTEQTTVLASGAACAAKAPADGAEDGLWQQPGFDDSAWPTGATGVGYDTNPDYGPLIGLAVPAGSVNAYVRIPFTFDNPGDFNRLVLHMKYDDGFVAWLNGTRVAASPGAPADPDFQSAAPDHPDAAAVVFEDFDITQHLGLINGGGAANLLAIQLINTDANSSDLLGIPELEASVIEGGGGLNNGSPGAQNVRYATNAAPNIRKVEHAPQMPAGGEAATITARITDPEGVASALLEYQVVAPGAYIPSHLPHPITGNRIPDYDQPRQENPAYHDPANWDSVPMRDDGAGADEFAGDGIYTAVLPGQAHRTLVRYRITVEDNLGKAARVPYAEDPSLNFAYFCYDGVPDYGAHPAATLTGLPVYQVVTRNEDWRECLAFDGAFQQIAQGNGNFDRFFYNWSGTFVYDGIVYDNIRYRLRGANGRYHPSDTTNSKRSMRFRFNKGNYFAARDQRGDPFPRKWRTLTTGKGYENRQTLTYGLNEAVNMYLWNKLGLPAQKTFWVHWRVVSGADEAPDAYHGDFWGMNFVLETYDVRFLDRAGLPKANLYKLINQQTDFASQQRYQAEGAPADGSDHNWVEGSLTGATGAAAIRANVELEKYYLYKAYCEAVRCYDFWPSANKNMVYYFYPDYTPENGNRGKLWILPWDTDATWGPTWNSGYDVVYNSLFPVSGNGSAGGDAGSAPELWPAYYNTVRELRDLLWQEDQINAVIDEFAGSIRDFVAADRDRFLAAPNDAGSYGGLGGAGKTSFDAYVQDMKNFAFTGGSWPGGTDSGVPNANDNSISGQQGRDAYLDYLQGANGEAAQIPGTPTLTALGAAAFPVNDLRFQCGAFNDPQGAATFGAMEWRLAEVTDPSAPNYDPAAPFMLEIDAAWESGELTAFSDQIQIPSSEVEAGSTYRVRVRHRDDTGRWSHWSAPVEFTATLPDLSLYQNLVVSEFMYNPAEGGDYEWIEIANMGSEAIDLTDVRFTKGIDFDFAGSAITSLAPGARAVVVRDLAAFESKYGAGLPVAGAWWDGVPGSESDRNLSNGGEQLKLSFAAGEPIRDFTYNDRYPWPEGPPDGGGFSLVLAAPSTLPDHSLGENWRSSTEAGGTPGDAEARAAFAGDPLADGDGDRLSAFAEHALGTSDADGTAGAGALIANGDGSFTYTYSLAADDALVTAEFATDAIGWQSDPGDESVSAFISAVNHGDGTLSVTLMPALQGERCFGRLRITGR